MHATPEEIQCIIRDKQQRLRECRFTRRGLAEAEDGPPAPAVHDDDAEDVAGDLDEDGQHEVGVGVAGQGGGGEAEAVVAHGDGEPLVEHVEGAQGHGGGTEQVQDGRAAVLEGGILLFSSIRRTVRKHLNIVRSF